MEADIRTYSHTKNIYICIHIYTYIIYGSISGKRVFWDISDNFEFLTKNGTMDQPY